MALTTDSRQKLRPFFPPQTSLQSTNLRAALLRSLTELKKNGLLGRSVVLRKTMLDDCKGDRFEELISSFAIIVLKATLRHGDMTASRLLSCSTNFSEEQELPILLAHRVALSNKLTYREHVSRSAVQDMEFIKQSLHALEARRALVSKSVDTAPGVNSVDSESALQDFKRLFCGDSSWLDTILYEDARIAPSQPEEAAEKPMTKVVSSIMEHKRDLARWKEYLASMPTDPIAKPETTSKVGWHDTKSVPGKAKDHKLLPYPQIEQNLERPRLLPGHERLLASMEQELLPHPRRGRRATRPEILPTSNVIFEPSDRQCKHRRPLCLSMPRDGTASRYSGAGAEEQPAFQCSVTCSTGPIFETKDQTQSTGGSRIGSDLTMAITQTPANRSRDEAEKYQGLDNAHEGHLPSPVTQSDEATERSRQPHAESLPRHKSGLSLMERTRMSLAASISQPPKPLRKSQRRSSQFPVNQFETPRKHSTATTPLSPASNDSTPREKLFSDDAEYASVFKTRTKINMSPMISPDRSVLDDSLLKHRLAILNLDDESETD
jgi:hypothetical protein